MEISKKTIIDIKAFDNYEDYYDDYESNSYELNFDGEKIIVKQTTDFEPVHTKSGRHIDGYSKVTFYNIEVDKVVLNAYTYEDEYSIKILDMKGKPYYYGINRYTHSKLVEANIAFIREQTIDQILNS